MNCVLTLNRHIICVILIVLEHLESSVSQCSSSIINEISLKRSWKAWVGLMGLGSVWDSGLKCKKWNRWQRPQRIWSSLEGSGQSEDLDINQLVAQDRTLSTHHWQIFAFFVCIVLSNAFFIGPCPSKTVSQPVIFYTTYVLPVAGKLRPIPADSGYILGRKPIHHSIKPIIHYTQTSL